LNIFSGNTSCRREPASRPVDMHIVKILYIYTYGDSQSPLQRLIFNLLQKKSTDCNCPIQACLHRNQPAY
jgi:hypothetical protein